MAALLQSFCERVQLAVAHVRAVRVEQSMNATTAHFINAQGEGSLSVDMGGPSPPRRTCSFEHGEYVAFRDR